MFSLIADALPPLYVFVAQYDPLLEKGKGKFSKAEQDKRKRQNEWSGRANQ
jgi:hypothetical protein